MDSKQKQKTPASVPDTWLTWAVKSEQMRRGGNAVAAHRYARLARTQMLGKNRA